MSVHNWGENPQGLWTIKIMDTTGNLKNHGLLEDFHLVLHGTAEAPHHILAGPRVYDENYNTVQNERSEKRQNLKSIDNHQSMAETYPRDHRQSKSNDNDGDINPIPDTDNHWIRLLSRLNGNWVQ